jgi:hypothetical protein
MVSQAEWERCNDRALKRFPVPSSSPQRNSVETGNLELGFLG